MIEHFSQALLDLIIKVRQLIKLYNPKNQSIVFVVLSFIISGLIIMSWGSLLSLSDILRCAIEEFNIARSKALLMFLFLGLLSNLLVGEESETVACLLTVHLFNHNVAARLYKQRSYSINSERREFD